MADTQNLSDPFKLPKGNVDLSGNIPGQKGYDKNSQTKNIYKIDIPTRAGQTTGANENNPVAIYRVGVIQPIGTITSQSGFTPNLSYLSGVTAAEEKIRKAEQKAVRGQTVEINKQVIKPTAQKSNIKPPIKDNSAVKDTQPIDPKADDKAQQAALKDDVATSVDGERTEYAFIKYPKYLKAEEQDCIKFSIIKYKESGLQVQTPKGRTVSLVNNQPTIKGRNIIGTITLPIPAGITDGNIVSWQSDNMTPFKEFLGNMATGLIGEGAEKGKENAKNSIDAATAGGTGALKGLITAKFVESITGTNNILARTLGAIENPNTELLFNSPELRTFTFRFKLSPRGPEEAKDVRTIIRCFKQAMSVKRTKSSLLLRSPHTFAISYISGNKQHPYLNKFKECALTNCTVDYTPYGSYMTYGKYKNGAPDIDTHSMVAYELNLIFQELEPLFDDEYGNEPSNEITNIGY